METLELSFLKTLAPPLAHRNVTGWVGSKWAKCGSVSSRTQNWVVLCILQHFPLALVSGKMHPGNMTSSVTTFTQP